MKVMGTVCGSAEQAKPLVFGYDKVYVHTNIKPLMDEEGKTVEDQFTYQETQYDMREYLQISEEQRIENETALENALCAQDTISSQRMSDIEDALCQMDTAGKVE